MKNLLKWTTAILLALFIVFQMLPVSVFADGISVVSGADTVHTVTFDSDSPATYLIADGAALEELPAAPEKRAADFIGWYDGDQKISAPYTPGKDTTLLARYKEWDIQTLEAAAGGATIRVTGRMPSGCMLSVTDQNLTDDVIVLKNIPLKSSASTENAPEVKEEEILELYSCSLSILRKDQSEYQPEPDLPVTVTVSGEKIASALLGGRSVRVVHTLNDGAKETVSDVTVRGDTVSFQVCQLSAFGFEAVWNMTDISRELMEGVMLTGRIPVRVTAGAAAVEAAGALMAVDLSFICDGNRVQPADWGGNVTIILHGETVSRAAGRGSQLKAVCSSENGMEEQDVQIHEDGSASFAADRCGIYAILEKTTAPQPEYWTLLPDTAITVYETEDGSNGIQVTAEDHPVFKTIRQSEDWTEVEIDGAAKYVKTEELLSVWTVMKDENAIQRTRSVPVLCSCGMNIREGETIRLTADLSDFADCSEVRVTWEINIGSGWSAAGIGEAFEYTATRESLGWVIRARVEYVP